MGDECSKLVTITSDNHHDALVKTLFDFLCDKHGIDYDFRFGGRSIPAHKIILDVFLRPHPPKPDQVDCDLTVDGPTSDATDRDPLLDAVLEFMYTGTVTVRYGQMERLLELAREMGFQMLVDAIETLKVRQSLETNNSNVKIGSMARRRNAVEAAGDADSVSKRLRPIKGVSLYARGASSIEDEHDTVPSESDGSDDPTDSESGPEDSNDDDWEPKNGSERHLETERVHDRQIASDQRPQSPPLRCDHCDYKTWSSQSLGLHQTEHDPGAVLHRCEQCPKRYTNQADLANHRQLLHPEPHQTFQCPHCEYKVRAQDSYRAHMAKHDPRIKVLRCPYCTRRFFTEESLQEHVSEHEPYKCPRCENFETFKVWTFHNHLFSAHQLNSKFEPARQLRCPDCKFVCQMPSQMKYHKLAMHSGGIKPYKCPHCDYATARRNQVARHVKVNHLNIKKHLCEECGYRTVSQSALAQHKQKHSNLRPHKCAHCGKGFNDKGTMRNHQRVVHEKDGKPYICHICSSAYGQRNHLRNHLSKAHGVVVELSALTRN